LYVLLIYIRLSNVITEVTLYVLLIYIRLSNVITEVTFVCTTL
jgi:hypothetical protein